MKCKVCSENNNLFHYFYFTIFEGVKGVKFPTCKNCFEKLKKEKEIVILDNNELSIMSYAEEYPENWKKICKSVEDSLYSSSFG